MTRINRAAWKRIKARLAEPKQAVLGKFYPGTIKSITIDGREFPMLDPEVFERGTAKLDYVFLNGEHVGGNVNRFSIEKLFAPSDGVSRSVGEIEQNINERATR